MLLILSLLVVIIAPIFIILVHWGNNPFQSRSMTLAASFPIGLTLAMLLTAAGTTVMSTGNAAVLSLTLFMLLGYVAWRDARRKKVSLWRSHKPISYQKYVLGISLVAAFFLSFLIWKSFAILSDGSAIVAHNAAPDVSYHLAQVTRIAFTKQWDFQEPNFSGEFIRYPFLVNMASGLLVKVGIPLDVAFHAPMVLLAAADMLLLAGFLSFIGLRPWLMGITTVGFLLGGSLGYIAYWNGDLSSLPLHFGAVFPMQNISYPSMIPGFLVMQRPFLLGLGLFIVSFWLLVRGIKEENLGWLRWSGVIVGLMPFAHMHSFISMVLIVTVVLVWLLMRRNSMFFDVIRGFVFSSFFIAVIPLVLWTLLPRYLISNVTALRLGWMSAPGDAGSIVLAPNSHSTLVPWILFMATNFGLLIILPIMLWFIVLRRKEIIFLPLLALGGLALWVIPNMIRFQIWDFDTNKFFAYALLLSLAAVSFAIQSLHRYRAIAISGLTIIVFLSIPSSIIAINQALKNSDPVVIFTGDEMRIAQWLRTESLENTALLSSVFLADSLESIQNPVMVASGRKATIGFNLWLVTHGINYNERLELVQQFLQDPATHKLPPEVPADYLLLDDIMREKYPPLEKTLAELKYTTVIHSGTLALIKL